MKILKLYTLKIDFNSIVEQNKGHYLIFTTKKAPIINYGRSTNYKL
ncbi:MAG: hypothetical protein JWP29_5590 [Rhodoferax sp.]|nr:hypothetical protein [Rhodoferax sp.]